MTKINLWDQSSHPLAKLFYELTGKVEMLGSGPEFTDATHAVETVRRSVEVALNDALRLRKIVDEISDLATTETDAGPAYNFSFLDDMTKARRFTELLNDA